MQRKLQLSKGAILWEKGDVARNIAVLEKGKLEVVVDDRLVSILQPRMILGESALLTGEGTEQRRTATVKALEDDTLISEYPPKTVREAFDAGSPVPVLVLRTLIAQICKNALLIITAHLGRPTIEEPLKALMRSVTESVPKFDKTSSWDEFVFAFRFLFQMRDFTEDLRERLVLRVDKDEAVARASQIMSEMFKGMEIASMLEGFIHAERERMAMLEVHPRA